MNSELDLSNPDNFAQGFPHSYFAELRRSDPVHWQDEADGPGFWNITKYEDLKSISRQPLEFSSWRGGTNMWELPDDDLEAVRLLMVNMDPPKHAKFRRLVSTGFTPKRIDMLREHVAQLARATVDSIAALGECDFVDSVAAQLPMATICEMLGVPEADRRLVYDLSNKLIGFDDPEFQHNMDDAKEAAAQMYGYAESLADERRRCPMHDLTTVLIEAEVDGEHIQAGEFDSFFLLLAIAGNETTRTVTAQGMRLLLEHDEARREVIADPSLLPNVIEEMLRYNPAVMHFRRTATTDMEIRGRKIREGDKVILWYPSANRDEEVFDDADRFDIHREFNEHLAFGVGEHYCLGANLARLQLNAIFAEILHRLPDIVLNGEVCYLRSNFIDGIKEMPVRFTPEAQVSGEDRA